MCDKLKLRHKADNSVKLSSNPALINPPLGITKIGRLGSIQWAN